jgi:hypothetical protein
MTRIACMVRGGLRVALRKCCARDQQPDNPDCATMRIAATGGLHHLAFAGAANLRQLRTQGHGRHAVPRGARERGESWFERVSGAQHDVQIEIAMRAAAALIHQRGLGRESRLFDQRGNGELGQQCVSVGAP